jgi:hypothetical protein
MLKGFSDNGFSYEQGWAILKRDGVLEWISPQTQTLLKNVEFHLMKNGFNIQALGINIYYWFFERCKFAFNNATVMGIFRLIFFTFEFLFLLAFTQDDKISIFNPHIFGIIPMYLLGTCIMFQITWNTWFNTWWAKGNIFIIMDHIFALTQAFFTMMDIMNIQLYQYTFRLFRYISFFASINYLFFYTVIASVAYELMGQKDALKNENDHDAVMDIVLSMVALNSLPTFAPTAMINLIFFLKELTMN